tara:strand:+ start:470 stop:727 length:258 start_codon:yes stop_codon:yes gene_type:complete
MTKYGNFEDHIINEKDGNNAKNFFLFIITNELAEANRLKRFELSQKYPQRDIHGDEKYAKAELVDQVIFPIDMDREIHYRSDTTR